MYQHPASWLNVLEYVVRTHVITEYTATCRVHGEHSEWRHRRRSTGESKGWACRLCEAPKLSANQALRRVILSGNGSRCDACGTYHPDPVFFDLDHKLPTSMGGELGSDNIQVLCPNCHRRKSFGLAAPSMPSCIPESIPGQRTLTHRRKQTAVNLYAIVPKLTMEQEREMACEYERLGRTGAARKALCERYGIVESTLYLALGRVAGVTA